MSTSGVSTYTATGTTIINGALRIVGAVSQGDTPTASQTSEALEALNLLVKAYEADGMPLWAISQYSVPLTEGYNSYSIGESLSVATGNVVIPKPLKVIQCFLHDSSSGIDIPVRILTRDEYNRLGNKTSTGQPIQIFYEPLRTTGTLHVFPSPDSYSETNCTLVIVYQRPYEDVSVVGNDLDFPQEWFEAVKFGLANVLAPEYGVEITHRNDIRSRAKETKDTALGFGTEEGSLYFGVDSREW